MANIVDNGEMMITALEAADMLFCSVTTLANWRMTGRYNLPYYRIGGTIRYKYKDVVDFLNKSRIEYKNYQIGEHSKQLQTLNSKNNIEYLPVEIK